MQAMVSVMSPDFRGSHCEWDHSREKSHLVHILNDPSGCCAEMR